MPGAWSSSKTRSRGMREPGPSRPRPTARSRVDGNKALCSTPAPHLHLGSSLGRARRWPRLMVPPGSPRRSCPALAQPAQPRPGRCCQRELGDNDRDQDNCPRITPPHKAFPRAPPGVQLCLQAPQSLPSIPSSPGSCPRVLCRSQPAAATGASLRPKASG